MVKPVIAITGPQKGAFGPRTLVSLAVRRYGGRPIQLRPGDTLVGHNYDGVVVTGGHDIHPVLYASQPEVEPNYDEARDAFELEIIEQALTRHLPLLGICRGAQLLNARLGGSLFQELRSRRKHTSNRWTVLPLKTLQLEPDTKLANYFACANCKINSLHNQGIDQLGDGLRVAGRDMDGIIQAVEDPSYGFLMGVQWHPEFLIFMRRQRRLFKHLVAHARVHATQD